jgi:hypothetical protein
LAARGERGEQPGRQIAAVVGLEIHGQEGHVEGRIPAAQARVELDGIDHPHRVRVAVLEVDVLEAQIAVPVAGRGRALLEARREGRVRLSLPLVQPLDQLAVEEPPRAGERLAVVLLHVAGQDGRRSQRGRGRRLGVEAGQTFGQPLDVLRAEAATGQQHRGAVAVGQPAHAHGVIDHRAPLDEAVPRRTGVDRHHPVYTSGARRRPSRTSSSQQCRRFSTVEKSRKP